MSLAQSVRQRLLNLSRETTEPYNLILTRFALERLLYRISRSKWNKDFLLKGAMLFSTWQNAPHRPTRDLDLMKYGNTSINYLKEVFQSLCRMEVEDDGIEFIAESVKCADIREGNIYQGMRVKLEAVLAGAKLRLQIDIGFGDAVVPEPEHIIYPTLLEFPAPRILAYSRYTMVAEKFHAMFTLGIANSRMKDFYDLWVMSQKFDYAGAVLCKAIEATFKRQGTGITSQVPIALTGFFSGDAVKKAQWNAFLRKNRFDMEEKDLAIIIGVLRGFLLPPLSALANKQDFQQKWSAGGPWDLLP